MVGPEEVEWCTTHWEVSVGVYGRVAHTILLQNTNKKVQNITGFSPFRIPLETFKYVSYKCFLMEAQNCDEKLTNIKSKLTMLIRAQR